MDPVVADNLVKAFPTPDGGEKLAVEHVHFHVQQGHIFGLLGPNGAGKTTTLRMLSGLVKPTSGSAAICGYDVQQQSLLVKRNLGFLTANTGLYQRLSVRDMLMYFAKLHGMTHEQALARAAQLIDAFDMAGFAELRCGSLSTGQKQRGNIARALVADPPVLILDEPTLGLDVLSNRVMLDFIRKQRDAGKTILLSTHYLDEAESLCDRIGLLHRGRIIAEGTLDDLRQLTGEERLSNIFLKLVQSSDNAGGAAA
ncbi:MAG: ATP-binding cassette domain-containing protein [Phycisphaeraceae bacterium]|nr:ATP-binding cassette domain-containing protein [Phycisphaeraceae bacterium]